MNALFVKSTTATGQPNAGNVTDATLVGDPTQYDGTLYSGGPDRTRYVIWDLGSPQMITGWTVGYNGSMSGAYVDFSNDGATWVEQHGPTGSNGSTSFLNDALPDGGIGPYRYVRFRPNAPSGDWAIDETRVNVDPGGVVGGPVAAASRTVTGLYNFAEWRTLISAVSFTVVWSDALTVALEYSLDGSLTGDAAYATATWTAIPVLPAPTDHGGTVGFQSWHVALPFRLDCNLLRLTCVGSGSVRLTDFRVGTATDSNLWSTDGREWYLAPLLIDGAADDGTTGYSGA